MDNLNEFSRENLRNKLESFLVGKKSEVVTEVLTEVLTGDVGEEEIHQVTVSSSTEEGFENKKIGSCCSREVKMKLVLCVILQQICMISAIILFSGMPEFVAIKASFAATALVGGVGVVAGVTLIAIIIYSVVKCIQERRRTNHQIVD